MRICVQLHANEIKTERVSRAGEVLEMGIVAARSFWVEEYARCAGSYLRTRHVPSSTSAQRRAYGSWLVCVF